MNSFYWFLISCLFSFSVSFLFKGPALQPNSRLTTSVITIRRTQQIHHIEQSRLRESSDNSGIDNALGSSKATKGFGKAKDDTPKMAESIEPGVKTYELQAKRGVPEYNIFLRPVNGTDAEWIPVGSMTIPRDTKVSKAIYDVEAELLKGTYKLYPKLKAYADLRKDKTNIFEYGYVLKAFPDEPIRIVKPDENKESNFLTNWLTKITNPLDTTDLKNKGGNVTWKV